MRLVIQSILFNTGNESYIYVYNAKHRSDSVRNVNIYPATLKYNTKS